jgi:hypothetical protein
MDDDHPALFRQRRFSHRLLRMRRIYALLLIDLFFIIEVTYFSFYKFLKQNFS